MSGTARCLLTLLAICLAAGFVGAIDKSKRLVVPLWQPGMKDEVEFSIKGHIDNKKLEPLPNHEWEYLEHYTDIVEEVEDGQPTRITRTYSKHSCLVPVRSTGKKRERDLAPLNPPVEGVKLDLLVKGGKVKAAGTVGLTTANLLKQPGALGRWIAFASTRPLTETEWHIPKADFPQLLPTAIARKIKDGFVLCSHVEQTEATVTADVACRFLWKTATGIDVQFMGTGKLEIDRKTRCVSRIEIDGPILAESKEQKLYGTLAVKGTVRRTLPPPKSE